MHKSLLMAGGAMLVAAGALVVAQTQKTAAVDSAKEWPTYGHDSGGMRFSPLTELTPKNVDQLKVAWVYHLTPPRAAELPVR